MSIYNKIGREIFLNTHDYKMAIMKIGHYAISEYYAHVKSAEFYKEACRPMLGERFLELKTVASFVKQQIISGHEYNVMNVCNSLCDFLNCLIRMLIYYDIDEAKKDIGSSAWSFALIMEFNRQLESALRNYPSAISKDELFEIGVKATQFLNEFALEIHPTAYSFELRLCTSTT